MSNNVKKVVASALLAYFMVYVVTALLGSWVEEGVLLEAWYSMIKAFPFGGNIAEFSIEFFDQIMNLNRSMNQYTVGIQKITIVEVLQDVCLLIVTALCYEALYNWFGVKLEIKRGEGISTKLLNLIWGMVAALLSTLAGTLVMNFLYAQMNKLPSLAQGFIAIIVSLISVGGAFEVFLLILGASVLKTIGYVIVKVIVVNATKVVVTYCASMFVVLFINEGAYIKVSGVFATWGVVMIIIIGLELMVKSVFGK